MVYILLCLAFLLSGMLSRFIHVIVLAIYSFLFWTNILSYGQKTIYLPYDLVMTLWVAFSCYK